MSLHIENFGKIKKADIELNGLTVVAGQNDTGKSTIGKALFAIVKSISEYPELYEEVKRVKIFPRVLTFNFEALNNKVVQNNRAIINEINELQKSIFDLFKNEGDEKIMEFDFLSFFRRIKNSFSEEESKSNKDFIRRLDELLDIVKELPEKEVYKEIVNYVFMYSFEGNVNNSCDIQNKAMLSYIADNEDVSSVAFVENKIESTYFNSSKKNFVFGGVTFIDTPLYLENFNANSYIGNDLVSKLKKSQEHFKENDLPILKKIDDVLNGAKFSYNDKKDLEYRVNATATPLRISNIASGEKAFGILYVLLKGNQITRNSIIVLDEPENHLHPEWQLKYAEFLTLLVKEGYYILLTSHSPFFLQALKLYADKYGVLENKTHFYLAEKINDGSNYSTINDVTDNTEEIFANLAAPIDKLFEIDGISPEDFLYNSDDDFLS